MTRRLSKTSMSKRSIAGYCRGRLPYSDHMSSGRASAKVGLWRGVRRGRGLEIRGAQWSSEIYGQEHDAYRGRLLWQLNHSQIRRTAVRLAKLHRLLKFVVESA